MGTVTEEYGRGAKNVLDHQNLHVVKVCIVGVAGSGKTALLNRFISNTFQVQPDEHGAPPLVSSSGNLQICRPGRSSDLPRRSEWNQRDTGDRERLKRASMLFPPIHMV